MGEWAVSRRQKAVSSSRIGSVAIAAGPFCFGSAELFLNSAACMLGNHRRAAEFEKQLCATPLCWRGVFLNALVGHVP
jgi:hypothetical protein